MLRIHTGLRKWNEMDQYHILIRDNNPMGIYQPCIKISNSEALLENYRMALMRDKYAIVIQKDDAIKRNRLFFDFLIIMFNNINQLYEKEKSLLIYTILPYQSRKESAKENTSKPSPKKIVLRMRQTKQVDRIVTHTNPIRMQKKVHAMKQAEVKKKMLECVKVGENMILSIQTKNQMEKVVKRRRLNYLSVVGKVTLKI